MYESGQTLELPARGNRLKMALMGAIVEFIRDGAAAFDPQDIEMMSTLPDEACAALHINGDATAREAIAIRIIELARRGERSPTTLREQMLQHHE